METNTPQVYQPLPPVPEMEQQPVQSPVSVYQQTPAGGSRKTKAIVAALILLIIVVLIAMFAFIFITIRNRSRGPVEITYWGLWEDEAAILPLIAEYESENPDVKINYIKQSPTEYRERLTSSMARGNAPDIFRMHNTWTPMFYEELAPLPESVMTAEEYSETFYPAAIESLSTPNGIGAIPLMYDSLGLFINQDLFTTFSAAVPDSWDEFRQTATSLTVIDPDNGAIRQSGAALGRIDNVDYWQEIVTMMMIQNGVRLSDPKSDLASNAISYFLQFRATDNVWDETLPESTAAFSSGRQLAMLIAPSFVAQELKSVNPNLRFRVHPVPQLPKFTATDPDITYAVFWAEGVWAGSTKTEQSWEFLKFLSSQESLKKLYKVTKEPYSRRDMAGLLVNDQYYGATIKLAGDSRTWYTASNTQDGKTGLNTQLENALANVFDVRSTSNIENDVLKNIDQFNFDVRTILSRYGLAAPPPPPEE